MAGRRFLLMHVTTGSGHRHAAQAIAQALRRLDPHSQVVNVSAFDYTTRMVSVAIMRSYFSLIQHHPNIWEYLYDNPAVHARLRHFRQLLHRYHATKLQQLLETVQPHAIACTQAFPCGMVADFQRHQHLRIPLIGVLTDYAPHLYWLHDQVDAYVVPDEELKERFMSYGIDASRLHVYGIPVNPAFLDPVDRQTAARQFGLNPEEPIVLVMGGGGGFGPLRELILSLDRIEHPCQYVLLAGTNHALLQWARAHSFRHRVWATGYVDTVPQLMSLAALIISKPGGLTTAESLAKGLPMLMLSPIPGQEMCNARYLLSHGAALQLDRPEDAGMIVGELLEQPHRLEELRRCANRVAHPHSASDIAQLLINQCSPVLDTV